MQRKEKNKISKKIILVSNSSWYFYNFRLQLLKDIESEGFELILVAPKDEYTNKIREFGFTIYSWKLKRRSVNPINELLSLLNLLSLYKKLKPDLVHHFTIKSCIYGTIAAKLTGVLKVINAIIPVSNTPVAI